VVVVPAYPQAQAPSSGTPEIREYSSLYLIAFRDHVIRAALAYWTEDGTLYYLDQDHKVQHAPLNSVDRDFSVQLNRERRVPFRLPE
jgi:hypothetical protein